MTTCIANFGWEKNAALISAKVLCGTCVCGREAGIALLLLPSNGMRWDNSSLAIVLTGFLRAGREEGNASARHGTVSACVSEMYSSGPMHLTLIYTFTKYGENVHMPNSLVQNRSAKIGAGIIPSASTPGQNPRATGHPTS